MGRVCYNKNSQSFNMYSIISRNFSSKNSLRQSFIRHCHQLHLITKERKLPLLRKITNKFHLTQTAIDRSFCSLSSGCNYERQNFKNIKGNNNIIINEISHNKYFSSSIESNIKSANTDEALKAVIFRKPTFELLLSYVDVSVHVGNISHAQDILLYFIEDVKSDYGKETVLIFNIVLNGWASEGNWEKVAELLGKMESLLIKPNLQSYSAAIESIVRSSSDISNIKQILAKIENRDDLSLENLFEECRYVSDQREKVFEGIRLAIPDFNPKKQDLKLWNIYDSDLLKELKSTETKHDYKKATKNPLSLKELQQLVRVQLERECDIQIPVPSIKKPVRDDYLKWREIWNNYIKRWQKSLSEAFQENVLQLGKNKPKLGLYPYLIVLKPEAYVDILMQVIHRIIEDSSYGMLRNLQKDIGIRVMNNYFLQKKKQNGTLDKITIIHEKFVEYYCDPNISMKYTPREYWELLQDQFSVEGSTIHNENYWPREILRGIAVFMLQILRKNVLINENLFSDTTEEINEPAFNFMLNDRIRRVKCTKEIKTLYLAAYGGEMMMMDSTILPMLAPPVPWTSFHNGGFLAVQMSVFQLPEQFGNKYRKQLEHSNPRSLYGVFDALNKLSSRGWKVNEPLLDIAIDIYSNGGNPDIGIPLLPPSELKKGFQIEKVQDKTNITEEISISEFSANKKFYTTDQKRMEFALSIANTLRKNIFWAPHTADYRGRAYPCPNYFRHLGNDVIRSLFLFADGEELGEKGLEWLKIHLVNLTGARKNSSLKQRLEYFDEISDDIMDSADKPLTGRKWWMKSKNPWETLACSMEITKCLRSPEPLKYICHLPVHQDGSANILQHYSALLRNEHCAQLVNLVPQDKPADVYIKIAGLIEIEREKDEAKNIKIAKQLKGYISRNLVKSIVITILFGASHNGLVQTTLAKFKESNTFPTELRREASNYLATKATDVAGNIFCSIKQLQNWFHTNANIISNDYQESVKWISPLGFPVIQPLSDKLDLENMLVEMLEKDSLDFVIQSSEEESVLNVYKQMRAFPSNYIQCLEASHMMLTALHCQRHGIPFVSAHDCFWTLPSTVDLMNEIIRQQFVALYSQPLLKNLGDCVAELYIHPDIKNSTSYKSQLHWKIKLPPEPEEKVRKTFFFFSRRIILSGK